MNWKASSPIRRTNCVLSAAAPAEATLRRNWNFLLGSTTGVFLRIASGASMPTWSPLIPTTCNSFRGPLILYTDFLPDSFTARARAPARSFRDYLISPPRRHGRGVLTAHADR